MRKQNFLQKYWYFFILPAMFIFWQMWSKSKKIGYTIGSAIQNSTITAAINQAGTNINPQRAATIQRIADDIYKAFYKYGFGFFEDEEAASTAFNSLLNNSEAIACAIIYRESFQKGLYDDIMKYDGNNSAGRFSPTKLQAIKNN